MSTFSYHLDYQFHTAKRIFKWDLELTLSKTKENKGKVVNVLFFQGKYKLYVSSAFSALSGNLTSSDSCMGRVFSIAYNLSLCHDQIHTCINYINPPLVKKTILWSATSWRIQCRRKTWFLPKSSVDVETSLPIGVFLESSFSFVETLRSLDCRSFFSTW